MRECKLCQRKSEGREYTITYGRMTKATKYGGGAHTVYEMNYRILGSCSEFICNSCARNEVLKTNIIRFFWLGLSAVPVYLFFKFARSNYFLDTLPMYYSVPLILLLCLLMLGAPLSLFAIITANLFADNGRSRLDSLVWFIHAKEIWLKYGIEEPRWFRWFPSKKAAFEFCGTAYGGLHVWNTNAFRQLKKE